MESVSASGQLRPKQLGMASVFANRLPHRTVQVRTVLGPNIRDLHPRPEALLEKRAQTGNLRTIVSTPIFMSLLDTRSMRI